jgi:hypothetical protein
MIAAKRSKIDQGVRTMKKVLAMLILGATIALPAATAFAEPGDDHHPDHPATWQATGVTLQTEPTTPADPGTLAGPGSTQPYGPYFQQRLDNMGGEK